MSCFSFSLNLSKPILFIIPSRTSSLAFFSKALSRMFLPNLKSTFKSNIFAKLLSVILSSNNFAVRSKVISLLVVFSNNFAAKLYFPFFISSSRESSKPLLYSNLSNLSKTDSAKSYLL